jgi:hypothetical protein
MCERIVALSAFVMGFVDHKPERIRVAQNTSIPVQNGSSLPQSSLACIEGLRVGGTGGRQVRAG